MPPVLPVLACEHARITYAYMQACKAEAHVVMLACYNPMLDFAVCRHTHLYLCLRRRV